MVTLEEMHHNVTRLFYDKIKKFCAPLINCFGISHFYFFKINNLGQYTYAGLRPDWEEYFFAEKFYLNTPCFRHPDKFTNGIFFPNATNDEKFEKILQAGKKI